MLLKNIVIICLVRKKGFKSYIWILFLHNKQLVFNCIGHLHKSFKIIYIEKVIGMIFYLFYLSKNNHKKVLNSKFIHDRAWFEIFIKLIIFVIQRHTYCQTNLHLFKSIWSQWTWGHSGPLQIWDKERLLCFALLFCLHLRCEKKAYYR